MRRYVNSYTPNEYILTCCFFLAYTHVGGVYVEDAIFTSTDAVEFMNNSAGVGGGGLAGSSQSLVRIMGPSVLFQHNVASKVFF
jgi:predicted outer membrane repeat protein